MRRYENSLSYQMAENWPNFKVDGFDVGVFDTRASKWLYTAASAGIFYIAVFSGDDHIVKEFRLTDDQRREFSKMANYLTYLTHDLAS
ncbi:MAG: hypothetical protein QXF97_08515 [Candidatus Caldarchaeum sp.]